MPRTFSSHVALSITRNVPPRAIFAITPENGNSSFTGVTRMDGIASSMNWIKPSTSFTIRVLNALREAIATNILLLSVAKRTSE